MPAEQSIHHMDPERKAPRNTPNRNPSMVSNSSEQGEASNAKAWAQRYHALGMNVVPWGPNKAPAEVKPGKRFEWGQWQNRRQTAEHIAKFPWGKATGVAAICGSVSGDLVCVDFDHPKDEETVAHFLKQLNLSSTYAWVVRSPSGGYHVWLRAPGLDLQGKRKLDQRLRGGGHVELRSDGHCTTLPPTLDIRGKRYEFLNGQTPEVAPQVVDPSDLLRAYNSVSIVESRSRPTSPSLPIRNEISPYVEAALQGECHAVRNAAPGIRNDTLNRAAYNLGQFVSGGEIDRSQVETALHEAAVQCGLGEHEATATIRSGINAGINAPRQVPTPPKLAASPKPQPNTRTPQEEQSHSRMKRRPKNDKALIKKLADAILTDNHFAQDKGGELYHFREGVYQPNGAKQVRSFVKHQLLAWNMEAKWSTHLTKEVTAYILVDSPELRDVPPMDTLNVRNGLLDVATGTLLPHSPNFLSPIQLPVTFEPGVFPAYWDNFCRSTFPEDAYKAGVHWQIVAWLMLPNTSLQQALLLLGDGGNGKSRFLAGIRGFLGISHVTALSLQKIETDRFARVRLLGKLANICPDLPSQHLLETATFKQLTGDDGYLTGERKGQDSFEFPCFARLVFSANQPPKSSDTSEGFYRRWIILPLTRTFAGAERIDSREIDRRLTAPEELSGVLNMALQYLPQVLEHGITETESMKEAHREFREVTDPLAVWLERETFSDPHAYIEKDTLRRLYNESPNATSLSAKKFTQGLKRHRPKVSEGQHRWGDNPKARCYVGIGCHGLYKRIND